MWKDRRSLFGLGAGMIIGAILLQLISFAQPDGAPAASGPEAAAEQLQRMAEELGYAVYPKSERRYTEQELDERLEAAHREWQESRIADGRKIGETSHGVPVYLLVIEPGMGSQQVAEALVASGLIDDAAAFEEELRKRRLAGRIQAGSFTFVGQPELTEIIETITSS